MCVTWLRPLLLLHALIFSLLGKLDIEDPGHDDFELWSPSEERAERCLFGRQVSELCFRHMGRSV